MPREIAFGDAFIPGLLVVFLGSLALLWLFDWLAGRYRLYRFVLHPALFRLAVFVCVFGGMALSIF